MNGHHPPTHPHSQVHRVPHVGLRMAFSLNRPSRLAQDHLTISSVYQRFGSTPPQIHTYVHIYIYILIKWWIVTNQCTLLFPYPRMSHGAHGTYLSQNMWLFLHNLLLDHCKRNISRWEVQIESVHVYMHKA